jgi:hypothetical protein
MNATKLVLILGVVSGIGMLAWAASGVVMGKILTKSYGGDDGQRRYSRYVFRDQEPVWFWVLCTTYGMVGIGVLVAVTRLITR